MKIFKDQAASMLYTGDAIAIPTDTVYGLASNFVGLPKLYELKKRPKTNPIVLFINDTKLVESFIETLPPSSIELMTAFWPGPLTLVLGKFAFRIPSHQGILALLEETGPLYVTSANISGEPPLLTVEEIENTFGKDFPILHGELPKNTAPSTVLSFENNEWQIDRLGPLTAEDFFSVLGYRPKNKLTLSPVSA